MISEIFKDKLDSISNDELLIAALMALFDENIEKERPIVIMDDIRSTINNEVLGEQYRSYFIAKNIIEKSFNDLRSFKINKTKTIKFNKEQ
jgi:hypothetical protein